MSIFFCNLTFFSFLFSFSHLISLNFSSLFLLFANYQKELVIPYRTAYLVLKEKSLSPITILCVQVGGPWNFGLYLVTLCGFKL
jgi:hypothetical protein